MILRGCVSSIMPGVLGGTRRGIQVGPSTDRLRDLPNERVVPASIRVHFYAFLYGCGKHTGVKALTQVQYIQDFSPI